MPAKRNAIPYRNARKVTGWGYQFDSLTELKYAISIMDEYHFLRSPVAIYYHPGTKVTLDHIRRCHLRYTPDFLIRHKQTYEASLVEIKPRAFENHPQLALRKAVAENYIIRKNLDWKFKIVFDDQIILSEPQQQSFDTCLSLPTNKAMRDWFTEYYHRHGQTYPDNMLTNLIVSGPKTNMPNWKQIRLL
jgi:hypothetical protein